jgi:hypothetical protein
MGKSRVCDGALRAIACKAAFESIRPHDMLELDALAARVFAGKVRFCPRDRPVAMKLPRSA